MHFVVSLSLEHLDYYFSWQLIPSLIQTPFGTCIYDIILISKKFHHFQTYLTFNSLRPSDAYINLASLVQIMACRQDGAKSLSEPMMEYC